MKVIPKTISYPNTFERLKLLKGQSRLTAPKTVGNFLQSILAKHGLDHKVNEYNFIKSWPEVVGLEMAQRSKPIRIRGECLIVDTINSVWAQELSFHKELILKKLQRFLANGQKISDVEFRVGNLK